MANIAKVKRAKKHYTKSSHPPTLVMVKEAIKNLKDKKGSFLVAIDKYISAHYRLNPLKHRNYIKKALAGGVEKKVFRYSGIKDVLQIKGVGASGRFVLEKIKTKPKKAQQRKPSGLDPKNPTKKQVAKKSTTMLKKTTHKRTSSTSEFSKIISNPKNPVAKTGKYFNRPEKRLQTDEEVTFNFRNPNDSFLKKNFKTFNFHAQLTH